MENQSPLTLNPVFNDPWPRQGNILKRKILKASFPRCPLGFYTLRSSYKLQQAEKERPRPPSRGKPATGTQLSSSSETRGLLITFVAASFCPNPAKASQYPVGLRKTWPLA